MARPLPPPLRRTEPPIVVREVDGRRREEPPVSYPAPSTDRLIREVRAWLKANAWLLALLGVGSTTGMLTPWRDLLGLATKAEVAAERAEREKLADAVKRAQRDAAMARRQAGEAFDTCQEAKSQAVGASELAEAARPKRRR